MRTIRDSPSLEGPFMGARSPDHAVRILTEDVGPRSHGHFLTKRNANGSILEEFRYPLAGEKASLFGGRQSC